MRFCRPASRALSHLLRHDPVYHSSPSSFFSRHSTFTPLTRAFDEPFFSSPFSAPLYTVYEVRDDETHDAATNNSTAKPEQQQAKQEETKSAEPQRPQQQQQRSQDNRLTRHGDGHSRQRWLDRHNHRRHRHHHHPLSLFSPFDSLFSSPFFASSPAYRPLEITVDLYSTPTAYQVHAAIPGVRKEDIKLTVDDGVLTIEAERREERGRPAKTTATAAATSNASTTATASSTTADATAEAPKTEQPTATVEAKDNTDSKSAAEVKAQDNQPQQHEASEEEEDVAVHHVESYYGSVQRSLALPEDVNVEGLTAKYEDGVLKIELPRIEERKQQPKKINIM